MLKRAIAMIKNASWKARILMFMVGPLDDKFSPNSHYFGT